MKVIGKYRLKKNLPDLKAGVIFEHREYDPKYPDRGNPGEGVMILGWLDGMCQDSWSGETFEKEISELKNMFGKIRNLV